MFKTEKDITEKDIIEFYVDLIDEKEADKILNIFNEKVIGFSKQNPHLNLKKIHIKNIFKKQTPKTQKIKPNSIDPFTFYCQKYNDIILKTDLNENEYKQLLYDIDLENLPFYKKFMSIYANQYEHTLKLFPKIKENFKIEEGIFDFEFQLNNLQEAKDYILKTNRFTSGEQVETIINMLENFFCVKEKEQIEEIEKQVKNLNFLNFHKKRKFFLKTKEYKQQCLDYAYIKTHRYKESKEILLGLCYNTIEILLINFKKNIKRLQEELIDKDIEKNKGKEKVSEVMEDMKNELEERARIVEGLLNENENLKERIIKQKKLYEKDIEKIKKEFQEKELEMENILIGDLLNEYKKVGKMTIDVKEFKNDLEEDELKSFFIIVPTENKLVKTLFPEIKIYTLDNWKKEIKKIDIKDVISIYIQRDGIPSNTIMEIKEYAYMQNIESTIFRASSSKKLVEQIGYFKNKIKETKGEK